MSTTPAVAFDDSVAPHPSRKNLRGFGIFAGRFIALLAMPLVALFTLLYLPLILLSSNEFPIWRQKRVGFQGKDLLVPKFSTMNADKKGQLQETWFGRLVRPVGLDEILQIWLIAKGEMQWFGPRPFLRQHINGRYIESVLFDTKPGFINTRSLVTGIGNRALQGGLVGIDEMIAFDRQDLESWSPFYAGNLLLRTLRSILRIG